MTKYQARVRTEHASRYLQQLCKHWGHRFAVEFDTENGVVDLNGAICRFHAEPQTLLLTLETEALATGDEQSLPKLCNVVTEHLKRFAFREELDVRWAEMAIAQTASAETPS